MRLSKNAKEFVVKMVKDAFADDLKAVEARRKELADRQESLWAAFEKDYDAVMARAKDEVTKLVKKHRLTFRGDRRIVSVHATDAAFASSTVDSDTFEQTSEYCSPEMNELNKTCARIDDSVRNAVSKALFEIEMSGRRDSVDEIVAKVIGEIREEARK